MIIKEISITIEKNLAAFEYGSFARGYHAYMDIWNTLMGEMSKCKRALINEVDKRAIAIMRSDSLGKESVVEHIPKNVSKLSSMFLMISFTPIEVEVVSERLNRRGGY